MSVGDWLVSLHQSKYRPRKHIFKTRTTFEFLQVPHFVKKRSSRFQIKFLLLFLFYNDARMVELLIKVDALFGRTCLEGNLELPYPKDHSYENYFSNSLIIHQAKTKKITTVKEVLIPGLN